MVRNRLGHAGAFVQPNGGDEGRADARVIRLLWVCAPAAYPKHAANASGFDFSPLPLQYGNYQRRCIDYFCPVCNHCTASVQAGTAVDPRCHSANTRGEPRQYAHTDGKPTEPLSLQSIRYGICILLETDAALCSVVCPRAGIDDHTLQKGTTCPEQNAIRA